jgi:murein DD-endopeptidase MepM/ murein hydrolase activator NlpD
LKMRCFAVWSVMPVTVMLVVGAEAAGVSARDGRLVPGGDSIAAAATHRTAPGHLTRPDGREETLAALRFRWPVYGRISSDFGAPRASRTGFHVGVDIGASRGTFVRAPAGGTVAFVGWRRGYGRTIVIDHGHQISTLYGHLAKPDVVRGQTVEEGAGIGLIGATGHASGPHLHYEVLVNGRPVNPRLVFARPQDIYGRSRVAARGREEVNEAAQRLGVELVRVEFRRPEDLEPAFATLSREGAKATIVASTPALGHLRDRVAALALKNRLPTVGFSRSSAEAGLLMSYGMPPDLLNHRAADYVDKILKGERPAELPVQQSVKTELVINLKTANALGVTIPQTLLQRADQVIDP